MNAFTVFPSANDIAVTIGDGKFLSEKFMSAWVNCFVKGTGQGHGFCTSGAWSLINHGGTTLGIGAGTGVIRGRYVKSTSEVYLTGVTLNATNHVFLYITVNAAGQADSCQLVCSTTNALPTVTGKSVYGLKLYTIVMGATGVTTATSKHPTLVTSVSTPSW